MKRKKTERRETIKVIEDTFKVESVEDGGAARIACISDDKDQDSCLFVRIQSWDELSRHEEFRELEGELPRR
jgi:hypothetical protein